MKLIDILVRELPKHGGWPDGVEAITQDSDKAINKYDTANGLRANEYGTWEYSSAWIDWIPASKGATGLASDYATAIITRAQYEAALAASKQEWNGEGLPPVGCECELSNAVEFYTHSGSTDFDEGTPVVVGGTVNFGLGDFVAVKVKGTNCITDINPCLLRPLRPLRSEADKKRDVAIANMDVVMLMVKDRSKTSNEIYDAIAAGKIPGVKLEG